MAYRFAARNDRFLSLLASLYAQGGQGAKADSLFQQFVGDQTVDPGYFYQLANFMLEGGDSTWAARYLEEAISLNPNQKRAHTLLADIYERGGDRDAAEKIRKKWFVEHPGDSL